ncbi:MAG: peptidoglycan bridge formation glycyltransferase FemA/FemB family protein [Anaerolineae bacterium]|nr:peptidoglycan bridge formation glycyltransferase FemA/FemB family protein [Anaerolineae bacterium]
MTLAVQTYDLAEDERAWDDQVTAAPDGHILQSWTWGELKGRFGWRVERLGAGQAIAQILYRHLPGGVGSIAYVPKGPLLDWDDGRAIREFAAAIRPWTQRQRAICLKIEPDLEDCLSLAERIRAAGFRLSPQPIQPQRTIVVDLDAEPEVILARMKQKTRYNIRLAGRKGVTVRPGDEGDLPAFYRLMEETSRRDGFAIHSRAYYETAHRLFVPTGRGRLLLAEHGGRLLAGLVAVALGDTACYMYGASADEGRELMASYLLQWEAMMWARERGCRAYDLWGVPDEDESRLEAEFAQRGDGLWGVYRFKRGFGGRLVRTVGAWDLVYAPVRYWLYNAALRLQARLI